MKKVRLSITEKMMRMPLGYMQAKGSGYFHSLLIDSLEHLEYPLAYAIPETTSNVLRPVSIIGLLFTLIGGKRMVKHSKEVITHIPSETF